MIRLQRVILKVAYQPFVRYRVLLSRPTCIEECHPDHDRDTVKDADLCVEQVLVVRFSLVRAIPNCDSRVDDSAYAQGNQPSRVMYQPSKMESNLLSIVVFDYI